MCWGSLILHTIAYTRLGSQLRTGRKTSQSSLLPEQTTSISISGCWAQGKLNRDNVRQTQKSLPSGKDKTHYPSFCSCHLWSCCLSFHTSVFRFVLKDKSVYFSQQDLAIREHTQGKNKKQKTVKGGCFLRHVIPTIIGMVNWDWLTLCGWSSAWILIPEHLTAPQSLHWWTTEGLGAPIPVEIQTHTRYFQCRERDKFKVIWAMIGPGLISLQEGHLTQGRETKRTGRTGRTGAGSLGSLLRGSDAEVKPEE